MSAIISPDGLYRYRLERKLRDPLSDSDNLMVICMLNPSTADATNDDPTIRRCIDFARRDNAYKLVVVNLYGFRASKPADLWGATDPKGPDNDLHVANAADEACGRLVCAWGVNAKPEDVRAMVTFLDLYGVTLWCLGTTKDGHPRHPLYVKKTQPLIPWSPR